MSEIEETEQWLKKYADARRKAAGTVPLRMPGPMQERLRYEVELVGNCEEAFAEKGSFRWPAFFKILVPAAAVATVAVVSYQGWQASNQTPASQMTATLGREEAGPATDTAASSPVSLPPSPAAGPVALPREFAAIERTITLSSGASSGASRLAGTDVSWTMPDGTKVETLFSTPIDGLTDINVSADPPQSINPSEPGYGIPKAATLTTGETFMRNPAFPETRFGLAESIVAKMKEQGGSLRFRSSTRGQILSSFALAREGSKITLTDSDGSRYVGQSEPMARRHRGAGSVAASVTLEEESKELRRTEASIEHFSATGVNETLDRTVRVTGSIFENSVSAGTAGVSSQVPVTRIRAVTEVEGQKEPILIDAELAP